MCTVGGYLQHFYIRVWVLYSVAQDVQVHLVCATRLVSRPYPDIHEGMGLYS